MSIDDFKEVYASKTPAEKLDLLLVQVDYYGDDMKNYAHAFYGLHNDKDAEYYRNEAVAMMERIKWLLDEIKGVLSPAPRVLSFEETGELKLHDVVWLEERRSSGFRTLQKAIFYGREPGFVLDDLSFRFASYEKGKFSRGQMHYGRYWRIWTAEPTNEMRKKVKWDEANN